MNQEEEVEVTLPMKEYEEGIKYIQITMKRKMETENATTDREYSTLKQLNGESMWIGGVL